MHVLIAAGSDWSYGGAILTFVFPMLLFIFVGGALYVAYTMPHLVPGQRYVIARRPGPTAATPARVPGRAGEHGGTAAAAGEGGHAAAAGEGQPASGASEGE